MLGKRPFIGKLSDLLISAGGRADPVGSPRTPLDFKAQSPRGPPRGYDLGGVGVGLGIVAALGRSGGEASGTRRVCGPRCLGRAAPRIGGGFEDTAVDGCCLENYTYVTCHGPNNESFTKVYYDGGLDWPSEHRRSCRDGIPVGDYVVSKEPSSSITSKEEEEDDDDDDDDVPVFQTLDFLSSCHLCGKKLHDRDIYMYRGEKAFCSTECRSRQIAMDERKEQKCRNEASKAADVSTSPYTKDRIFSTGIVAI